MHGAVIVWKLHRLNLTSVAVNINMLMGYIRRFTNLFKICSIVCSFATLENEYRSCLSTVQLLEMFEATPNI